MTRSRSCGRLLAAAFGGVVALLSLPAGATRDAITGVATVRDGDTVEIHGQPIRLYGIDAPEGRQVCRRDGRDWRCGQAAAHALADHIGRRPLTCQPRDTDRYGRPVAVCRVAGEDIGAWLVREGWALNFDPKRRFKVDQDEAQEHRRGLWKGCFVAPWDLRNWRKSSAKLLGPGCGDVSMTRNRLFPDNIAMPPGCPIKGKIAVRARAVGYRGIYHLETCRSYGATKNPNRWFCSEEEAKAAGFRKSYRC